MAHLGLQSLKFPQVLLFLFLASVFISPPTQSLPCTSQKFQYQRCMELPRLNSTLHYTYDPAIPTLSVAFVAPPASPDGWIAWAINPTGTGMIGSQTAVAFKDSNSGAMLVKTYNIQSYAPLVESKLAFDVRGTSAEFSDGLMKVFATFVFPPNWNATSVNHVWQVGASVTGGVPDRHSFSTPNMVSKGTLDLLSGQATAAAGGGDSRRTLKNIHGILNALSWGTLFPMGIVIVRYMRFFPSLDPLLWFYLHIICQLSAYAIGVAGWGTGLKLGSQSPGIVYTCHRNIGTTLFTIATLQLTALFFRPKKDHKYRIYWNVYHHAVGYTIATLGVVNVFKGLAILDPDKVWRWAYISAIGVLGGIALILELITWGLVLRRKVMTTTVASTTAKVPV